MESGNGKRLAGGDALRHTLIQRDQGSHPFPEWCLDAFNAVLQQKSLLIACRLVRQYREMPIRRSLDDLVRKNALKLRRKPASDEYKAATAAQSLHHRRNRRLYIDLGEYLDVVRIGHQVVCRGAHRAKRLVQQGVPDRIDGARILASSALGVEVVYPGAKML